VVSGESRSKRGSGAVLLALSVLTKQYMVFPILPLFIYFFLRDKRSFAFILGIFLVCLAVVSIPFIVNPQSAQDFAYAVARYPVLLNVNGHDLKSGLPNIGFSGIWSALLSLGLTDARVYSVSSFVQIMLMAILILVVLKKRIQSVSEVAMGGFLVFLIGTKYLWHNYFIAFLPLALLVSLSTPVTRGKLIILLGFLLVGEVYFIADGVAFLINSYPPNYAFQDLLFFSVSSYSFYRLLKPTSP